MAMIKWDILTLLVIIAGVSGSTSPGVKVRVTKKGLAYANQVAHEEIVENLKTLPIPNQSGTSGHISYSLTDIKVKGVTPPSSSISLVPGKNAVTWSLSNFGIKVNSNWHVEYNRGWIHLSDSGNVDISLNGVDLIETAAFGIGKKGKPSIASRGCSDSIGSVDVEFHGGSAVILNLFKGIVESKIQDALKPLICNEVESLIDNDAEKSLESMDVTVELLKYFLLDYRLVSAPVITTDFIEIWDKGEVFWESDMKESPFVPSPILAWNGTSRMVYIWVTTYSPNTFLYQAHTHGFLKYNVTKKDLPPEDAAYLNTTCLIKCIGRIVPQIGSKYPNSWVELRVRTSSVPNATVTSKAAKAQVGGLVDMWAHTPDNKEAYLLTLLVNTSLTINASMRNEKLSGQIINHSFTLSVVKSAVGELHPAVLNIVFGGIMDLVIIPQLNKITEKGIVLPIVEGVQFENTQLILQEGNILIGTDLSYKVASETLNFKSENSLKLIPAVITS